MTSVNAVSMVRGIGVLVAPIVVRYLPQLDGATLHSAGDTMS